MPDLLREIRELVKKDPNAALSLLSRRGGVMDGLGTVLRDALGDELAKKAMSAALRAYPAILTANIPGKPNANPPVLKSLAYDASLPIGVRKDSLCWWLLADPPAQEIGAMIISPPDASFVPLLVSRLSLSSETAQEDIEAVGRAMIGHYDASKAQPGARCAMAAAISMVLADPDKSYQARRSLPDSFLTHVNRWARTEFLSLSSSTQGRMTDYLARKLSGIVMESSSAEVSGGEFTDYMTIVLSDHPSAFKIRSVELLIYRFPDSDSQEPEHRVMNDAAASVLVDAIPRQTDPAVMRTIARGLSRSSSPVIQNKLKGLAKTTPVVAEALSQP